MLGWLEGLCQLTRWLCLTEQSLPWVGSRHVALPLPVPQHSLGCFLTAHMQGVKGPSPELLRSPATCHCPPAVPCGRQRSAAMWLPPCDRRCVLTVAAFVPPPAFATTAPLSQRANREVACYQKGISWFQPLTVIRLQLMLLHGAGWRELVRDTFRIPSSIKWIGGPGAIFWFPSHSPGRLKVIGWQCRRG